MKIDPRDPDIKLHMWVNLLRNDMAARGVTTTHLQDTEIVSALREAQHKLGDRGGKRAYEALRDWLLTNAG